MLHLTFNENTKFDFINTKLHVYIPYSMSHDKGKKPLYRSTNQGDSFERLQNCN